MSREQSLVQRARKAFQTGKSKPLEYRLHQLRCLHRFITERRRDIADALKKDLCKVGRVPNHRTH
jgi:ribosomal protein S18